MPGETVKPATKPGGASGATVDPKTGAPPSLLHIYFGPIIFSAISI